MRNQEYKKVPNLLLKYRKINGLTQKKVAEILGIHPCELSKWEHGLSIPNLVSVFKLAVLYKTMVDGLFMDLLRHLRSEMKEKLEKLYSKDSLL